MLDPVMRPLTVLSSLTLAIALGAIPSCRRSISTAPDREAIATAVSAFHSALAKGDRAAVIGVLAPDAQILEAGYRQTREEYAGEHLASDIAFAKDVPSTREALIVRQEGSVAWTTVTSRSTGKFNGRDIDSDNAELMVLTKTADGWRIRSIHWSGQPHSKP
ncbi:MAG: nuclear transport factor 2 family protein [Chthoniobacterales bacterium]